MIQSMSGKGNCYDNALTETFFKSLKTEWIYGSKFDNQNDLWRSLFEYIEFFYNRKRAHSSIGYLPSVEYLRNYRQPEAMAS